jgi:3'(2'), 5'-bisphosphate nucleotidase
MDEENLNIEKIIDIAERAGKSVLEIYNSGQYEVTSKEDNSPLTKADSESNKIIVEALKEISISSIKLPVISEEEKNMPFEIRKEFNCYWLVDPLDGTKEFISRNGEFTINIALIENNFPVLGVIYVPVKDILYYGIKGKGSFKKNNGNVQKIMVREKKDKLTVVQSRSHSGEMEDKFYSDFNVNEKISAGSSLKFCLVAEGKADIYYRSGPTMEWDTAAGQAVAENAGGFVFSNRKRMIYSKQSLKNNSFIVSSFLNERFYE